MQCITAIGYSLQSINEPRFSNLIRRAAESCRCVELIEPAPGTVKDWEVFAATCLPRAKLVHRGGTLEEVYG